MDDLRARFQRLDRIQAPDLWHEAVMRSGRIASPPASQRLVWVVFAAALLLVALATVIAVGRLPRPDALEEVQPRLVAYVVGEGRAMRVWVANSDGSGARELQPGSEWQGLLGWTANGERLAFQEGGGVSMATIDGEVVDRWGPRFLCPKPCTGANELVLSPDASHIAFIRSYGDPPDVTVLAVLDLATGEVAELASTRTTAAADECQEGDGCASVNAGPAWSPDGASIAFGRPNFTSAGGGIFVVDADGTDLRRLTATGWMPKWSADGSRIAFMGPAEGDDQPSIYTVRSDGSELRRLTQDGVSWITGWTSDGRVAFVRVIGDGGPSTDTQTWIMDADGGNKEQIEKTSGSLTEAGCVVCIYPTIVEAYWQPRPSTPQDR